MGGRGASSGGSGADIGGGTRGNVQVLSQRDLVSEREGNREEVDEVLKTLRRISDEYGYEIENAYVSTLGKGGAGIMAYFEEGKNVIGVSDKYFDIDKINRAYERSVQTKYHPSSGSLSGMEATIAHEMGHALTQQATSKLKVGTLDQAAKKIVGEAFKAKDRKEAKSKAASISGYATENNAECVAEAFADVYCNGRRAKAESRAIYDVLKKYL